MSKRPASDTNATSAKPTAKRPRLDLVQSLTQAKTAGTVLLDSLKDQKTWLQRGQIIHREDIMTAITKAENVTSSLIKVEEKAESASATLEKLIKAVIQARFDLILKPMEMERQKIECYGLDEDDRSHLADILIENRLRMERIVMQKVKDTLEGLSVDDCLTRAHEEVSKAFKEASQKLVVGVLAGFMD